MARPGKRSAAAAAASAGGGDFVIDLVQGGLRRATVRVFRGNVQVDIREFYEVLKKAVYPPSQIENLCRRGEGNEYRSASLTILCLGLSGQGVRGGQARTQRPGADCRPVADAQGVPAGASGGGCQRGRRGRAAAARCGPPGLHQLLQVSNGALGVCRHLC